MPCIRNRKTSSGPLPYPASKPVPTPKKVTTKKADTGKVTIETATTKKATTEKVTAEKATPKKATTKQATTPKKTTKNPISKTPTAKNPKGKPSAATTAAKKAAAKKAAAKNLAAIQRLNAMLESEFVTIESPLPPTALGDLSNTILPLFHATNFPDVEDYALIEPSLRLASHLLQHPSLREMLRTILTHGPFIPVGENDNSSKSPKPLYEYPRNNNPVSDTDVALIAASLDELAEFVTFRTNPKHNTDNARTVVVEETGTSHRTAVLQGVRTTIEYSPAMLERLTKASAPAAKNCDVPYLLVWRFTFAVQLAHEVFHALTFAKDGHLSALDTDPFFPGAITAEAGFSLEEALFGGQPAMLWDREEPTHEHATRVYEKSKGKLSDLVGVFVVWPWPCTFTIRDYYANNCGIYIRKADLKALKPKDIAWRVPLEGLARFFTTEFWAQENPATLFDHRVGFAFSCDKKGKRSTSHVSKQDLVQKYGYDKKLFKVTKNKAIVRK